MYPPLCLRNITKVNITTLSTLCILLMPAVYFYYVLHYLGICTYIHIHFSFTYLKKSVSSYCSHLFPPSVFEVYPCCYAQQLLFHPCREFHCRILQLSILWLMVVEVTFVSFSVLQMMLLWILTYNVLHMYKSFSKVHT